MPNEPKRELPKLIINAKLFCPYCGFPHVDEERNGEKWNRRAHTTHRCQGCGGDFDVYVSGASAFSMSRDQAVEIARRHAKAKPHSYYAEPFQPHEWVVDAILEASRRNG